MGSKKQEGKKQAEIAKVVGLSGVISHAEDFLAGHTDGPEGVEHDTARYEAVIRYAAAAKELAKLGMTLDEANSEFVADTYTGVRGELDDAGWEFDDDLQPPEFDQLFEAPE